MHHCATVASALCCRAKGQAGATRVGALLAMAGPIMVGALLAMAPCLVPLWSRTCTAIIRKEAAPQLGLWGGACHTHGGEPHS